MKIVMPEGRPLPLADEPREQQAGRGVRPALATEDRTMKTLLAATAIAAAVALTGPVSAQMYQQSMQPAPAPMQAMPYQPGPMQAMPYQPVSGAPSWTQDDGSSSDHPIHNPGDVSGDRLNGQYQGGLDVSPPNGFPAPYAVPMR